MSQITIVVAENFARLREFVGRELERRPDFRVVTVSDGLAAVEKARELRPELVVLDIGLPTLNGLAAARRIRALSPTSQILFLTQESSPDVVQEALTLGSRGYIHKSCARHLMSTVEAILEDSQTIERGETDTGSRHCVQFDHQVQFYSDDATLVETGEHFLRAAVNSHDAAIAVVTRSHLRQLLPRLKSGGSRAGQAIEQGSFLQLDAEELASGILSDGVARWRSSLIQTLESAAAATRRARPRVAVFGECAGLLWEAGHIDSAMDLEQLGAEIVNTMSVSIMCAYPLLSADHDHDFKAVCAHHRAVAIR